jgi:hypothetical protein
MGRHSMDVPELWKRNRQYLCRVDSLDLTLDISRVNFVESFLTSMEPAVQRAFSEKDAFESGAIANPPRLESLGETARRFATPLLKEASKPLRGLGDTCYPPNE